MNTEKRSLQQPKLIVMLTRDDRTVEDAYDVFDRCKDCNADFFGFKEEPLPLDEMKKIYAHMKTCGKSTALEVVAYTEEECIRGAKMAVACGCDLLMGTIYSEAVHEICKKANLKYMPFVGKLTGRPSILEGTAEEMIAEANSYIEKGAYGIDLLGYRYTGDAPALIRKVVENVHGSICVAGSIDSYKRLDEIKDIAPWAFTIGSAFFNKKFGDGFEEQVNNVCSYINGGER